MIALLQRVSEASVLVNDELADKKVVGSIGSGILQAAECGDYFVARTGYTGEDGFEIMMPKTDSARFWRELVDAGIKPCGLGARGCRRGLCLARPVRLKPMRGRRNLPKDGRDVPPLRMRHDGVQQATRTDGRRRLCERGRLPRARRWSSTLQQRRRRRGRRFSRLRCRH